MKKIIFVTFFVFLSAPSAFGDEADGQVPNMATSEPKAGTSQMVRDGIESEDASRLTQSMHEYRFRHENTLRVQEMIMRAYHKGLPVEPIMNKAYEGMAKGIDQENIIRAMDKVMTRYGFAYQQAGELTQRDASKNRIMEQVAECIAAGVTDHDAERLVYRLRYRVQEMPTDEADGLAVETFRAVKDMARLRVQSMKATDLALEALKHRYGAQEMKRMRKSFMKHARDTSPNTVAEVYLNAIQQGYRLENLTFSRTKGGPIGSGRGPTGTGNSGGSHGGGAAGPGSGSGGPKGGGR